MKNLIDRTIKPFLIIAGLCTAIAGMNAFLPQFTVANILKLPFFENYTIIVQHWGMMILLAGIFMIISAFRVGWRMPVLIFSAVEKTFMIFLYLLNISHPFSAGFYGVAVMDAIIVIYLLVYFWTAEYEFALTFLFNLGNTSRYKQLDLFP
jgi:uncharacterized membrane protein YozB (DUF420 family)